MAASKLVELLGTQGLSESSSILVYNSNTFKDPKKISGLGITEDQAKLLSSVPNTSTINNIYSILIGMDEYSTISPLEGSLGLDFVFNNNQLSIVGGEGFDTIIFLSLEQIIGYVVLVSPVGYSVKVNSSRYSLKKEYTVDTIKIHVDSSNKIRVDEDEIDLIDEVESKDSSRDYSGESSDRYTSVKKLSGLKINAGSYDKRINSILKSSGEKNIFTDTFFSNISPEKNITCTKLNLKKNIVLPSIYDNLDNYQVGFYNGDIVLYLWSRQTPKYAIISLTKTLEDIFNDSELRYYPLVYTPARSDKKGKLISNSDVYTVPDLLGETMEISYFAGNYVIVKDSEGISYIFDINRQSGYDTENNPGWVIDNYESTGQIDYYKWDGNDKDWKKITTGIPNEVHIYTRFDYIPESEKVVGIRGSKPNYLNIFSIDRLSLSAEPLPLTTLSWQTYIEGIQEFPDISNTYVDAELLLSEGCSLVGKAGDWCIFLKPDDSSYIYSNLTKSIKVGIEEPTPIIINNQVLLTYSSKGNKWQYVLYDEPGDYITLSAAKRIYKWNESKGVNIVTNETRDDGYYVYTPSRSSYNVLQITAGGEFISSPMTIQASFLSYYRRNLLPKTMEGFRIIGAIGGIIYYKIGNTINYL